MNIPKLKNALLCRILVYLVVIVVFLVPAIIIGCISIIPIVVRVIAIIVIIIGFLVYVTKNLVVFMTVDFFLAYLHCLQTARKMFTLPKSFSISKFDKRISRFGHKCEPILLAPNPYSLQYKLQPSLTIYSSGIEKIIATYSVDCLDKEQYSLILQSAKANSKAVNGKITPRFLDKNQKKSPLNRVTIIIIHAKWINPDFYSSLFDKVCNNNDNEDDDAILPCILDLEKHTCIFDSVRVPYIGYQYPVKNRGIRTIRKLIFHGKFPYSKSPYFLESMIHGEIKTLTESSLWEFWKTTKKEAIQDEKEFKKRFSNMDNNEIIEDDDGYIYMKLEDKGVWISIDYNKEAKIVEIDKIESWIYPKKNMISKDGIKTIKKRVDEYFSALGYTTRYLDSND